MVGYHGCSRETAEKILAGEVFSPSQNAEDWLGRGIYFWEYAPYRALEWAKERFPAQPTAVLQAKIRLGRCLNLLDRRHFTGLEEVYQQMVAAQREKGIAIPVNTARGAHFLDRQVIDDYCDFVEEIAWPFQTVRGCFPEGKPLYEGSKILTKAHVQIAVRDLGCIQNPCLIDLA